MSGLVLGQGWEPSEVVYLPPELMEVSALTEAVAGRVSCLQDENGEIYIVDLERGEIVQSQSFGPPGDYEGLAVTETGDFWVLRSDGALLELYPGNGGLAIGTEYRLSGSGHKDFEGLAYDPVRNRLLVSAKDKDPVDKDLRHVFAFDLQHKSFEKAPYLELSITAVNQRLRDSGIEVPRRVSKKGKVKDALKLRFSSLAIRPGTGDLVLLSSSEPCLLTLDSSGTIRNLQTLDPGTLPKPEGLVFLSRDKLLIASEGKSISKGILQTFIWNEDRLPSKDRTRNTTLAFVLVVIIDAGAVFLLKKWRRQGL